MANGHVDAAIVGLGAQPLPPRVHARVVATEPLVLSVRRGDPLSRRRTITLAQLREQPMITLVRGMEVSSGTPRAPPGARSSSDAGACQALLIRPLMARRRAHGA